jgi:hypothetical protein
MRKLGSLAAFAVGAVVWFVWREVEELPIYVVVPLGAAVLGVFTVLLVRAAILKSLPEVVSVTPLDEAQLAKELRDAASGITDIGFERAGFPLRFELGQSATVVPLMNGKDSAYATAMRFETKPPKHSFDFVTRFNDGAVSVTSSPEGGAGILPLGDGEFLQIIEGADAKTLYHHHAYAVDLLRRQGLKPCAVEHGAVCDLLKGSIATKRSLVLAAPWRHTFVALYRTLRKKSPYHGPLASQAEARARLKLLGTRKVDTEQFAHEAALAGR